MSLDHDQRVALRKMVQAARKHLIAEMVERLEGQYGLSKNGKIEDQSKLPLLVQSERAHETRELLEGLLPPAPRSKAEKERFAVVFDTLVRELAYTHLNRLVAFKMMEHPTRGIIPDTVGSSARVRKGYVGYLLANPEVKTLAESGHGDEAYERYLHWRCRELNEEIGVLFDPDDLASRIFPRPRALSSVLELVNGAEDSLWESDETLGWTYQHYIPKELVDKAKKASRAPRDSFDLATRNQFYTPEYIVRFLTDNTLGRLWLEMKPDSTLRSRCEHLVIGPEETLPKRKKKDPREIRILDPACGSGHFLLYAFDLLVEIYYESWHDAELGPELHKDARWGSDEEAFRRAVPGLIVEHNLHGIDIDRRATQIASLALFLKAKTRNPKIKIRSGGIVWAGPMPGGREFLDEFKEGTLGGIGGTLGRLLDGLWGRMKLAGEAGSLLRVEDFIEDLLEKEKERLSERQRRAQQSLLPEDSSEKPELLDFSDIENVDFWWTAGERIQGLFREYATKADGAEGARRRLFAHDGVEVLRFIKSLQRQYDVVLMNPPFGKASKGSKAYIKKRYPLGKPDLLASFVQRGLELSHGGFVGALTGEAAFFRSTLEVWRRKVVIESSQIVTALHLGGHVLDGAIVRTAAYVLGPPTTDEAATSIFVRAFGKTDRLARLSQALDDIRSGVPDNNGSICLVNQRYFKTLPFSVFGYWPSQHTQPVFTRVPELEESAKALVGLQTSDDPRYVRLRWEVPLGERWHPFAKGGEFSPFHYDIHLAVNYLAKGRELRAFEGSVVRNPDYYHRPGLTYPLRTAKRLSPRCMPSQCVFSNKGPGILVVDDSHKKLFALLAVVNTSVFCYLLSVGLGAAETEGGAGANSYEVGLVNKIPVPKNAIGDSKLSKLARRAVELARFPDLSDETTAVFVLPFPVAPRSSLAEIASVLAVKREEDRTEFEELMEQIEDRVMAHYGLDDTVCAEIDGYVGKRHALKPQSVATITSQLAERIVSWAVGVVMGRWDLRLVTGGRPIPAPADPFDPVLAFTHGMLPGGVVPEGYPDLVDSDGILVEDKGHQDDIVECVRNVLGLVWGDLSDTLEDELCQALKVRSLRVYFQRSGIRSFWKNHFRAYSKSKRRAPIYWLLQSERGRYSVWLYYHKIDRDTLYKVLQPRYLLGRIERCRNAIEELRPAGKFKEGITKDEERQLAEEESTLEELESFEEKIRHVLSLENDLGAVVGYAPDINDGVMINAAPLYELIPWPNRKGGVSELEYTWNEVSTGELEWPCMAMHYLPDLIGDLSADDPSLAIAHGLEEDTHDAGEEPE